MSIANLEEYVDLVVDATIRSGILRQLDAFKSGFNEVYISLKHETTLLAHIVSFIF